MTASHCLVLIGVKVTDGACPQVRELDIFLSQDEVMFTQIPQPIMKG